MSECLEIIRYRPKAGAEDALLEERDKMLADIRARHSGLLRAEMSKLDDNTYIDVLRWESKDHADTANADHENIPGFVSWVQNVDEIVAFEATEVIHAD